jgi:hypothetical protein
MRINSVQFLKGLLNIFPDQCQASVGAEVVVQFFDDKVGHPDFTFKVNSSWRLSA